MRIYTIAFWLLLIFVASPLNIWAQNGPPGKVNFSRLTNSSLDAYTNSPTATQQQWFQSHFTRMVVYSPYFDSRTSWYPNGQVYQDLYAIYTNSALVTQHPEWILHDSSGHRLYIPWGCSSGTCPQYAADIANPNFRAWWITQMQTILSQGNYQGIFVDDVNMNFSVSDGNGNAVAPIDDSTGASMTWQAWRYYIAQFVMQIRQAFPTKEIVHNAVWFAGPDAVRDQDPAIQMQISAADIINLERGVGSDGGLTGGTGQWSVYALFSFIDRAHQTGHAGVLQQYNVTDVPTQLYSLAAYFMISSGRDYYADTATTPDNWWNGFDVNLGAPLGPRTYNNGIFRRDFTKGIALLSDPGTLTQTISLPGTFQTVDGQSVTSVTLSAKQGAILIGPNTGLATPALSLSTSSLPAATAGSFYNVGLEAAGGSGNYTFSASGLPAGIVVNGSNLAGTPSASGSSSVVITATDTVSGATAQSSLNVQVKPSLAIATASLPSGAIGTAYSAGLSATGGSATYVWSVLNQPAPLSITGSTLAGKPVATGTSAVTLTVMDAESGISMQRNFSVEVFTDPAITTASLPGGNMGVAYTTTLSASGGSGVYQWAVSGLPPGLAITANTITGTPTKNGTWSLPVTVTDQTTKAIAQKTLSIKISPRGGK
jgi:hypothetical protein